MCHHALSEVLLLIDNVSHNHYYRKRENMMESSMLSRLFVLCILFSSFTINALEINDDVPPEVANALELDENKITIIDFFASWCVSCRVELPEVSALTPQLDSAQVDVIGINVDEEVQEGLEYIQSFDATGGLNFRVVMDTEQSLIEAFGPIGMPALYYLHQGKVKAMHLGAVANISAVIRDDLNKLGYR